MPCCLYLASKLEECALHQGQSTIIIHAMKGIEKNYPYEIEDLLSCEYYLLQELEFDLIVFHPYQNLSEYLADANLKDCLEMTWFLFLFIFLFNFIDFIVLFCLFLFDLIYLFIYSLLYSNFY